MGRLDLLLARGLPAPPMAPRLPSRIGRVMLDVVTSRHYLQVLASVVLAVLINMMDMLPSFQYAPKFVFNHNAVLKNVAFSSARVVGHVDTNISTRVNESRPMRKRALLSPTVMAMNEEPRVSGVSIGARDVLRRDRSLLTAATDTQAVGWIPRWWWSSWSSHPLIEFGGIGIHLMTGREVLRIAARQQLEVTPASTRANRHIVSIYQVGAI